MIHKDSFLSVGSSHSEIIGLPTGFGLKIFVSVPPENIGILGG